MCLTGRSTTLRPTTRGRPGGFHRDRRGLIPELIRRSDRGARERAEPVPDCSDRTHASSSPHVSVSAVRWSPSSASRRRPPTRKIPARWNRTIDLADVQGCGFRLAVRPPSPDPFSPAREAHASRRQTSRQIVGRAHTASTRTSISSCPVPSRLAAPRSSPGLSDRADQDPRPRWASWSSSSRPFAGPPWIVGGFRSIGQLAVSRSLADWPKSGPMSKTVKVTRN